MYILAPLEALYCWYGSCWWTIILLFPYSSQRPAVSADFRVTRRLVRSVSCPYINSTGKLSGNCIQTKVQAN